jgi:glycosyltransferase involved in cell wall biosynthesis
MATPDPILRIGYAGTLMSYRPGQERRSIWKRLAGWVWTYRISGANEYTRSGYFLLKGVQRMVEKYPDLAGHLQIDLWGLIDPGNKQQVAQFGIGDQVQIAGYYTRHESNARLAACDLVFLPLETGDDPLYIPSKIFDYIKLGKPVLILGKQSDCTDILQRSGLGLLADPFDADAVADLLAGLIRDKALLPERHQVDWKYLEENFHVSVLNRRLVELIEEVMKEG